MGNCLKTQLKGSVNNNDLPIMGWRTLKYNVLTECDIINPFRTAWDIKARLRGDAYFVDSNNLNMGTSVTTAFAKIHANAEGVVYLDIADDNVISYQETLNLKNTLNYTESISSNTLMWLLEIVSTITNLSIDGSITSGNLDDLMKNQSYAGTVEVKNVSIPGNLANLYKATEGVNFDNLPSLKGNIEDLLTAMSTSQRTVQINFTACPNVFYNGSPIPSGWYHRVTLNGDGTWELAN